MKAHFNRLNQSHILLFIILIIVYLNAILLSAGYRLKFVNKFELIYINKFHIYLTTGT